MKHASKSSISSQINVTWPRSYDQFDVTIRPTRRDRTRSYYAASDEANDVEDTLQLSKYNRTDKVMPGHHPHL
jgi:hypothetical protein